MDFVGNAVVNAGVDPRVDSFVNHFVNCVVDSFVNFGVNSLVNSFVNSLVCLRPRDCDAEAGITPPACGAVGLHRDAVEQPLPLPMRESASAAFPVGAHCREPLPQLLHRLLRSVPDAVGARLTQALG